MTITLEICLYNYYFMVIKEIIEYNAFKNLLLIKDKIFFKLIILNILKIFYNYYLLYY